MANNQHTLQNGKVQNPDSTPSNNCNRSESYSSGTQIIAIDRDLNSPAATSHSNNTNDQVAPSNKKKRSAIPSSVSADARSDCTRTVASSTGTPATASASKGSTATSVSVKPAFDADCPSRRVNLSHSRSRGKVEYY
jgi:hypothetical protein